MIRSSFHQSDHRSSLMIHRCRCRLITALFCLLSVSGVRAQEPTARLRSEVRSEAGPVRDADVVVNKATQKADARGVTTFALPLGQADVVVIKEGFAPASASVDLAASQQQTITIDLNR